MNSGDQSPDFRLGKIEANTEHIIVAVEQLQASFGMLGSRVAGVESDIASLKAERAVILKDYNGFVHKVNNHMMVHNAWKSQTEGKLQGITYTGKFVWAGIGLSIAVALELLRILLRV